ncbi:MAG: uracil phosphoribosyltransferase [Armatimonadetes bacterium]|nr:uracil phosphoribosyltransferase [Armatimonadota bacterium]
MPLTVVEHALATHILTQLRDEMTPFEQYRALTHNLTQILLTEATRHLLLSPKTIRTPMEEMSGAELAKPIVVVPILRAGLGMLSAVTELLPNAHVGYIGLQRDEETAVARSYYCKLPDMAGATAIILDPMLATGGSAEQAIMYLQAEGAEQIILICAVAAPEGAAYLIERFPDTHIVAGAIDRRLNEQKYILPGLGDFGDRLFGT